MLLTILLVFLTSFLIAALISPLVITFYKRNGWIDHPEKMKHVKVVHTQAVPRGGGIVVFVALAVTSQLFLHNYELLFPLLLSSLILAIVGFWDDIKDISPYFRMGVGIVVALLVVFAGIKMQFVTHPFSQGVLYFDQFSSSLPVPKIVSFFLSGTVLTIVWIVWNMNIVNWSKGLDGQMPGMVGIAAIFLGILGLRFVDDPAQTPVILLSFILAGSYFGLLVWNAYPQKIMPGYGAGSLAGFFLAVLAIISGAKLATALLVLAIPTADAVFTITRRMLSKKSPFWGDRGHLHHKLMDVLGWTKPKIAWFYWITTALFGVLALQLKPEQKLFTIAVITILVFGFLIWVKLFISFSKPRDRVNG